MQKSMKFGRAYKSLLSPYAKRKFNRGAVVFLVIASVLYCTVATFTQIYPVIEDMTEKKLDFYGTDIINRAILQSIDNNTYNELLRITKDEEGDIISLSADTQNINKLKSQLTLDILNNIEKFGAQGFSVPLGSLTDVVFFSGLGPQIPFCIIPYGSVSVNFRNTFSSVGINQTQHELYVDITARLNAISRISSAERIINTSVLVAQTVVVGDVPQVFAGDIN